MSATPSVQTVKSHNAADWFLWIVIVIVIVFIGGYLSWSGYRIDYLVNTSVSAHDAIARAAVLNINSSTYVGFMLGGVIALIGCMITLRRVNARVELETQRGPIPGSFATDSGGLFVVTLGVVLIGLSIWKPRAVDDVSVDPRPSPTVVSGPTPPKTEYPADVAGDVAAQSDRVPAYLLETPSDGSAKPEARDAN